LLAANLELRQKVSIHSEALASIVRFWFDFDIRGRYLIRVDEHGVPDQGTPSNKVNPAWPSRAEHSVTE